MPENDAGHDPDLFPWDKDWRGSVDDRAEFYNNVHATLPLLEKGIAYIAKNKGRVPALVKIKDRFGNEDEGVFNILQLQNKWAKNSYEDTLGLDIDNETAWQYLIFFYHAPALQKSTSRLELRKALAKRVYAMALDVLPPFEELEQWMQSPRGLLRAAFIANASAHLEVDHGTIDGTSMCLILYSVLS